MDLLQLFGGKKSRYHKLRKKWVARHETTQQQLWQKHGDVFQWAATNAKHLAATTFGSLIFLATPMMGTAMPSPYTITASSSAATIQDIDKNIFLIASLGTVLPTEMRELSSDEESQIGTILSDYYHMPVSAELDGKRLNRSYGLIGAEQHLTRFPGDTIETHFDTPEEAAATARSGMAPGRGAWGYFASSRAAMTPEDDLREKYYIAVQTFLAPEFHNRVAEYRDFFKYRKMLVVNPNIGRAMVVVIGDAGPAVWTGKHLGGSPEVMRYLERVDGRQRGAVLYFFIDDPDNKVPLGPITL